MNKETNNNININTEHVIITPEELKNKFPLTKIEKEQIDKSRKIISNIIHKKDHRLLIVCGPCSIHDIDATIDYANKLKKLSIELNDHLYIIMRAYFEKPRTTIGWKGLINDPYMDNSFDIESGLQIARKLLLNIINIGIPIATETLDPNNPQYLGDLFSWAAIGARTTESQTHREIASGLSMPVGFKNSTDGSLLTAINAIHAASMPHRFLGINQFGKICLLQTSGNPDSHIILRGGKQPNYFPKDVMNCEQQMKAANLPPVLMIDCSHGNSNKDYHRQLDVAQSILSQIKIGNNSIIGLMLESNINSGKQSLKLPKHKMSYGVSITDACIDWKSTEWILRKLNNELKSFLPTRYRTNN